MHGLWLEDQELSYREDLPRPEVEEGQVLIKPLLAGICSTDLELLRGYYSFRGVIGHEFVGRVEEAPSHPDLVGKRMVGEINIVCGTCRHCRSGLPTHCLNRRALGIHDHHGAFAGYFTLPVENIHLLPDSVANSEAVFVEPLAAAVRLVDQVHIKPRDRVLVVGAGRLGQLVAQVLRLTGADLSVVARYANQKEILAGFGIRTLREDQLPEGNQEVVVDATGSPGGFQAARRAVKPTGTLLMKSTYAGDLTVDASSLVVDEINLIGSRCGPFEPAVRLLEQKLIDPTPLIAGTYPLQEWKRALEHVRGKGVLKVLLSPGRA